MGRRQQWVCHVEPEEFPQEFPQRMETFRDAAGLTWRGLAHSPRVNVRTVHRWKAGAGAGPGHLVSLFSLAAGMDLLHLLLPEAGGPEAAATAGVVDANLLNPTQQRAGRFIPSGLFRFPPFPLPIRVLATPAGLSWRPSGWW